MTTTPAGAARGRVAGRDRAAALRSRAVVETVLVLGGFLLLSVAMTWPLMRHFDTRILGAGGGGDASGYVWDFWFNGTYGLRLWGVSVQESVSAPFGRELPGSVNATLLVTVGPAWVLTKLFSPIVAYNGVALMGLTTTGASMYLLVRWLRLGVGPAIWAGVSFVLFPQEILRALGHPPLMQLGCFPLMIMAGLYWIDRPGPRRVALVAAALALAWLTNPYYGVMCAVIVAVVAIWGLWGTWRRASWRTAMARVGELTAACVLLVGVPLALLFASARSAVDSVFGREEIELLLYGARLTDYVRPLGSNPVWAEVFGSPFPSPSGERLNYVGWVTIALALTGIVAALWRRRDIDRPQRTAALLAVPLVPVLVLCSLASPTTVFGRAVDMPSRLIFEVLPFLRVFARFVVPVMAVLLVAGAVGLWFLVRTRGDVARISIFVTAIMLAVMDLPSPLPLGSAEPVTVNGASAADVPTWAWLRDRPTDEIVFELPGRPNEAIERYYMYGQTVHGHRITNGGLFVGQLGYDFADQAGEARWPNTAPWLASLGVDLVTINPWAFGVLGQRGPAAGTPPPGFAVEESFPDGSAIWRVTAEPADAVPVFRRQGWWASELLPDGDIWRWMEDEGRLTVVAPASGRYEMAFRARGLVPGATYPLEIVGPDGAVTRVDVRGETEVVVPLAMAGARGDVIIDNVGPDPRPVGPGDPRTGTVQVSEPVLTRVG